nr:PREDICTED: spermatogenesis-associated protein 45 [Struthio camelus australis]
MSEAAKKHLIALNMAKESRCLVEGQNDSTWLRPQRRHFPQSNRSSLENLREKEPQPDSGRSSWTEVTCLYHKERRHFPERSKFIYNRST